MAKAFWKGTISFGMVMIPVRMYLATRHAGEQNLHYLHKKCLTRPRQMYYCEQDNEYFTTRETVKGYEFTKGRYVVLNERDFEKVSVKTTHTIDIHAFVTFDEIDPVYFVDAHYVEPEELGAKPFFLLREALVEMNKVAVAKVTFGQREHVCCLRPTEEIMTLHTMRYRAEILPRVELTVLKPKIRAEELEMARSLMSVMPQQFKPEDFRDDYRQALRDVIEAKTKGLEITPPPSPHIEVGDLMAALRASIEAAKQPAGVRR